MIEKQPEQLEIGKNEGFNTSQIYYGDYFPQEYGDSYLQGQQDGGCFGKVNNNAARIVVGDGGSVFVNKQNPLKAFASTQMGNLSSTNSAIPPAYNYSRIGSFYNNHPNWITQFAGNNSDGNQIYISDKTSIQRTLDGGTNFSAIATHSLNSVKIAVQDTNDPLVYAVGYNPANGKLDLISIQNAATNPTFSTRNDILSNYYGSPDHIEIDPNDDNSVFLTSSSGKAFKISNINSSAFAVKSIMGDAGNIVFNTVVGVKNKPEIFIAGTNIGLFYSTNSGDNWFLSNELPYTQITDLKLRESDNRLFVFTHGRGTWAVTVNTDTDLVYEISGSVNPSNAGTVSGTGLIKNYFTATLVATPAPGFRFVNWTIDDIVVSTSENYSFTVTQSQALVANFESVQIIPFKVGWNIFSSQLKPTDSDIKSVSNPLITKNSLVKIQDEEGQSFEDWGVFGGWQNHIGNISPTEGYKIKLSKADSMEVCGAPVKYPFAIPLQEGWNIIGYPQTAPYDGMEVVQQLIDRRTLVKVQEEGGNSIEDWGIFGSWQNDIGDFVSGEGYTVKVSADDTLWINESYPKSSSILLEVAASIHFKAAFEGNGIDHMNINLVGLPVNILRVGDELAIFDGSTCVGAVTIMPRHLQNQTASIAASARDNQGMPGFAEGNPITLKLWNSKQNTEFILEPKIVKGTSTFAKHETTLVSLEKFTAIGLEGIAGNSLTEINCYPNPFSDEINIEIKLAKDSEVQVEVLNQMGQRVKILQTAKMLNSGVHRLTWNGRNAGNGEVAPGIYHLRLEIDDSVVHRKVVMSK